MIPRRQPLRRRAPLKRSRKRIKHHRDSSQARAERLFSRFIRTRDEDCCRRCGRAGTDAAHLVARSIAPALQFHTKNAVALCREHHAFYTNHPIAWRAWCEANIPWYKELLELASMVRGWKKREGMRLFLELHELRQTIEHDIQYEIRSIKER